jgi:hypothetical protein
MIKNPKKEIMINSMNLAKVNLSYFVLNKYWWASDKLIEEIKIEADYWEKIDDEVYVFQFKK